MLLWLLSCSPTSSMLALQLLHQPGRHTADIAMSYIALRVDLSVLSVTTSVSQYARADEAMNCTARSAVHFTVSSALWQEQGRHAVGEAAAVAPLIFLLDSVHTKVRSRAVGALHNLSSDSTSIRTIRRSGGIPRLVALLR